MTQQIQQLVYEMAQALVDAPQAVHVSTIERDDSILFRLRVAQPDIGKVIGKQGRTARSLRSILGAAAAKHDTRCTLDILE